LMEAVICATLFSARKVTVIEENHRNYNLL
jgi:hypothetical protein